jgi:hypothetical protein
MSFSWRLSNKFGGLRIRIAEPIKSSYSKMKFEPKEREMRKTIFGVVGVIVMMASSGASVRADESWDVECAKGYSRSGTLDAVKCVKAVKLSGNNGWAHPTCAWRSTQPRMDIGKGGLDYCYPEVGNANPINCPINTVHIRINEGKDNQKGVNDRCYKKCNTGDWLTKVSKDSGAISDVDDEDTVDLAKYDIKCRDTMDTKSDVKKPELKKN